MTRYFLGVDTGNSKSHALVADEAGRVLGIGLGGCGSPEVLGYEGFGAVLQSLASEALTQAGLSPSQISAAGFGVAGYDWPSQTQPCLERIASLGLGGPSGLVNDALVGMLAGAPAGWGVGLVAGTGSNCWGMDKSGRVGRMTGLTFLMDEGGGAGHLVLWGLQAVGKAYTLRGPQTMLTELFLQRFGEPDVLSLLQRLSAQRELVDPSLAPLVMRAAHEGDAVALQILQQAAESLASLCLGVARQLKLDKGLFDVVLIGGVFQAGELLIQLLRNVILDEMPGAHLLRLEAPPVLGGVVLAAKQLGLKLGQDSLQRLQVESNAYLKDHPQES